MQGATNTRLVIIASYYRQLAANIKKKFQIKLVLILIVVLLSFDHVLNKIASSN